MAEVKLKSDKIIAHCMCQSNGELSLSKLTYPDIYIPNRSFAISLSFKDKNDEMVLKVKKDVEEYNSYLDEILSIDGFWEKLKTNGYYISKKECETLFGFENTEKIFSLRHYQFQTEICKNGDWMFLLGAKWRYYVEVDGGRIDFETEETDGGYPRLISIGKDSYDIFWNWYGDERDFCFYLWESVDEKNWIVHPEDDEQEPIKYYSNFECYDQGRDCMDKPDPNIMKIFKMLQDMGYLRLYYVEPEQENPIWELRAAPDGKIGMMLLNRNFEKNPLLVEKIKLLLNCAEEDVDDFILTDEADHQYQSKTAGMFGGHNKLKIYGRMDCPSANRYVKNGKYVQHRVFFADEETAVKAGYRPCAKCMPEAYKKWKAAQ